MDTHVFNIVILTFQLFLDLAHGCHVPTTVKNKELKKIITTKIDALQVKMTTTKNENDLKQMNQERALLLKELESVDVISTLQNEIVQKQSDWRSTKELSQKNQIEQEIMELKKKLDILINNAGVLKSTQTKTTDGLDIRFVVNTLAPYRLMQKLLPIMGASGRVVNVSSAAQVPVNLEALKGNFDLEDNPH